MKKIFILCSLILSPCFALAALPPFYQSVNEIKALLELPEVGETIGSHRRVEEIKRTSAGYLLTAGECQLEVKITYLPIPVPGPAKFKFNIGTLSCQNM